MTSTIAAPARLASKAAGALADGAIENPIHDSTHSRATRCFTPAV